ncbi:hypothetical protein SIL81_07960 [Xanthomonas campestris pv. incanae]|uniref:hypothetical protein n=1 Tax=Xanthomonas campestris TaxID=339 RepID=UPI0029C41155|nr:hypothetical protein [Xanthomonas campestris]MDX6081214.1 hypothetical protein [Xanthomonas campestris pv. incanae]MDX6087691.1 hypothetical protein [Xanthomonas campestris pv. incanae]MDX6139130.1 hypothetical protein [Xanthomonas campestris pv. incanae]
MAKLWEISVVIALRDQQWLMRDASMPMPAINLSGNAESRLGDCLLTAHDRFFVIEIKPTTGQFSAEWKKKTVENVEQFKKRAFASTLDLADRLSKSSGTSAIHAQKDVLRSLLGHHFVYWDDAEKSLCIQPYLSTVLAGYKAEQGTLNLSLNKSLRRVNNAFSLSLSQSANPTGSMIYTTCAAGVFSEIYSKRLGIAVTATQDQEDAWIPLGLLPRDFADYLESLCTKTEEIDVIILSDNGFTHELKSTVDITDFLTILSEKIKLLDSGVKRIPRKEALIPTQKNGPSEHNKNGVSRELSDYFSGTSPTPPNGGRP